jgi:hypothetical protein
MKKRNLFKNLFSGRVRSLKKKLLDAMRRNATVGYFLKASLTKVSRKSIFKFPSAK